MRVRKRAAPGAKPRGRPKGQDVYDWEAIREWYLHTDGATYDGVNEKFGPHTSTVKDRAASEGWVAMKAKIKAEAMEEALRNAMDNRARGADALTRFSYQEAMAALSQLSVIRRNQAATWGPTKFLSYARSLDSLVGIARVAIGLPREITADLTDAVAQWDAIIAELEATEADRNGEGDADPIENL